MLIEYLCRIKHRPWFWENTYLGKERIYLFKRVFQRYDTELSAVGVDSLDSLLSTMNLWDLNHADSEQVLRFVENIPEGRGLSAKYEKPSSRNLYAWNLFLAILERSPHKIVICEKDMYLLVGSRSSLTHFQVIWNPILGNQRFRFLWRYPYLLDTVVLSDLLRSTDWNDVDGLNEFVKFMTTTKTHGICITQVLECVVSLHPESSSDISWECLDQIYLHCTSFGRNAIDNFILRNGINLVNQACTILIDVLMSNRRGIAFECAVNLLYMMSSSINLPHIDYTVCTKIIEHNCKKQCYCGRLLERYIESRRQIELKF